MKLYEFPHACMILAMATKRTVDGTKCNAWVYEEDRPCRVKKPRDRSENELWYCQNHSLRKRAKLWLRYKWKHMVLWKRLLLAPILVLCGATAHYGPDVFSFMRERKASQETDMRWKAVQEHFSEESVRAYLDHEYPLGYILYAIHNGETVPALKDLGPRLEVLLKRPYLINEGGKSYINLNVAFRGRGIKSGDYPLPIPPAKGFRLCRIWVKEYGLVSEFIEEREGIDFVCLALSDDQKLFPARRRGLEFTPKGWITGTCSLDREYVAMIVTGTLVNTSGDNLDLGEIQVIQSSGSSKPGFRPMKFGGADGTLQDGGKLALDPARNLAVTGLSLSSKAREDGYLAFVTTALTLQQLRQLVATEGMTVHLESYDSDYRREVWSEDFRLGETAVNP